MKAKMNTPMFIIGSEAYHTNDDISVVLVGKYTCKFGYKSLVVRLNESWLNHMPGDVVEVIADEAYPQVCRVADGWGWQYLDYDVKWKELPEYGYQNGCLCLMECLL